jgi:vitamin B12 transporter
LPRLSRLFAGERGVGRVEIVRGPQSALYGADAMTGVIQLFTPRGEGPFSAWVSAEGGNYATYEVQTGFSWGNKYAGVFFEYGYVSTQGILPVNNDADNSTLALRLDLSPIPELDFTFTGRYVASHVEVPTEGAGDRFDALVSSRSAPALSSRWTGSSKPVNDA